MRKTTIELTPKTTKWIFVFNGIINSGLGLRQLSVADSWTSWGSVLGLLLTITGPLLLIYGLILFNRANKLTPKVQVDNDGITIKEDIHKIQRRIDWRNVREINYKPFELNFHMTDNNTETVNLSTNGEISLNIKKTIRQFAEDKQIKIVGG
jgi:hypothetical protein